MRKIFLILSSFSCVAMLSACSNSGGGGSSNPTTTPYGYNASTGTGSGLWFTVQIMPECSASSATVSLSNQNGASAFQTMSVSNGGSTNFVVQAGYYTVTVQAGACNLSGQIQFMSTVQTFNICLGNSCQSTSGYTTATYSPYLFRALKEVPCNWGVYGCQGAQDPGTGSITIQRASISFSSKKDTDLNLDLTFSKGNNLLMAMPGLAAGGWNLTAKSAGGIVSSKVAYDGLVYDAQADDKLLQFKEGFCGSRDDMPAKMSDYLTAAGFSAKSVASFQAQWAVRMPPNDQFCTYPQNEEEIRDVVNYKSSVASSNHRVWFIMIPQENAAVSKIRKFPAQFAALAAKPKVDALASIKKLGAKNRSVANDPDLSVEEWGVGFLIER